MRVQNAATERLAAHAELKVRDKCVCVKVQDTTTNVELLREIEALENHMGIKHV